MEEGGDKSIKCWTSERGKRLGRDPWVRDLSKSFCASGGRKDWSAADRGRKRRASTGFPGTWLGRKERWRSDLVGKWLVSELKVGDLGASTNVSRKYRVEGEENAQEEKRRHR